jgi:hypothetical protein
VMGPVPRPGGDLVMQRPKSRLLVWGDRTPDRNQEVAVTVHVSVAHSEGTLQVRADEVGVEDPGGALSQLAEQVVELRELCRARVVAQLRVVHRISQSEVAWLVARSPAMTSESGLSPTERHPQQPSMATSTAAVALRRQVAHSPDRRAARRSPRFVAQSQLT